METVTGGGGDTCVPPTAYESCRGLLGPLPASVLGLFFGTFHMQNRRVAVPSVGAAAGGEILAPAVVFPRGAPPSTFVLSGDRQYDLGVIAGGTKHSCLPLVSPMC